MKTSIKIQESWGQFFLAWTKLIIHTERHTQTHRQCPLCNPYLSIYRPNVSVGCLALFLNAWDRIIPAHWVGKGEWHCAPQYPLVIFFQPWVYSICLPQPIFYMDSGYSHSVPHCPTANILTTKPYHPFLKLLCDISLAYCLFTPLFYGYRL